VASAERVISAPRTQTAFLPYCSWRLRSCAGQDVWFFNDFVRFSTRVRFSVGRRRPECQLTFRPPAFENPGGKYNPLRVRSMGKRNLTRSPGCNLSPFRRVDLSTRDFGADGGGAGRGAQQTLSFGLVFYDRSEGVRTSRGALTSSPRSCRRAGLGSAAAKPVAGDQEAPGPATAGPASVVSHNSVRRVAATPDRSSQTSSRFLPLWER
jgi:hypothetical protein